MWRLMLLLSTVALHIQLTLPFIVGLIFELSEMRLSHLVIHFLQFGSSFVRVAYIKHAHHTKLLIH